jgi:hypothetical protein
LQNGKSISCKYKCKSLYALGRNADGAWAIIQSQGRFRSSFTTVQHLSTAVAAI